MGLFRRLFVVTAGRLNLGEARIIRPETEQYSAVIKATAHHSTSSIPPKPIEIMEWERLNIRFYDASRTCNLWMPMTCPAMRGFFQVQSPPQTRIVVPKPQPRPPTPTQLTCVGSSPLGLCHALQFQWLSRFERRNDSSVLVGAGGTRN